MFLRKSSFLVNPSFLAMTILNILISRLIIDADLLKPDTITSFYRSFYLYFYSISYYDFIRYPYYLFIIIQLIISYIFTRKFWSLILSIICIILFRKTLLLYSCMIFFFHSDLRIVLFFFVVLYLY